MSNTVYKINPSMLCSIENEQVTTTSLQVSEVFGKRHADVIRKIESLDIPEDFASAHFCVDAQYVEIGNSAKRKSKVYTMTKDGFVFLAMGFTGEKAAQFKVAYINAFNKMAEQLQQTERETIAKLEAKLLEIDEPPKKLTPEQQRHIQETVGYIFHTQGIAYQTTYHNIKTQFKVGTYKDIKRSDYPALCRFLGVDPIYTTTDKPAVPADPAMAGIVDYAADRIMLVAQVEEKLSKQMREMESLREELADARYRTFDLVPYLRDASRRLNA